MGRLEKHLDPAEGPLAQLAFDLRTLRCTAGSPTYREMSRPAGYSPSALSAAASGSSLPSAAVLAAYVRACDGDVEEWLDRRTEVALALRTGGTGGGGDAGGRSVHSDEGQDATTGITTPAITTIAAVEAKQEPERAPRRRRFSRHIAGLAAAAALGSMATVLPMAIWGAPSCLTDGHGRPSTAVSCPQNPGAR